MASSILQRLTAGLCLAVALLTGILPAQGLVLCLEPDGCVSIEIATSDQGCESCEDHEERSAPAQVATRATDEAHCPCVDLPLSGSFRERIQPKQVVLQLGSWIAGVSSTLGWTPPLVPPAARALQARVPRPPEPLELIRSVVLLV